MSYRPNNEDRNSVETPPITSSSNNINNNRSNYLNRERSNSERGRERSGSIIGDRTSSDKDPDDYRDINDHGKEIELSATIESRKRRKNSSSCDNLMTSLPERHFSDSQVSITFTNFFKSKTKSLISCVCAIKTFIYVFFIVFFSAIFWKFAKYYKFDLKALYLIQ